MNRYTATGAINDAAFGKAVVHVAPSWMQTAHAFNALVAAARRTDFPVRVHRARGKERIDIGAGSVRMDIAADITGGARAELVRPD
ncbi:hypothetical protein GGQ54_002077 [Naumannella cuiyingiana]|uniref:Uncharacterized protein n=1 Tax=Naumannella cuiyingiana TaxID=1347891 RepID=A0A7Z0D9Z2_9ACTN|nr:hypothetical protein [Naumannella cuiyingiana]NYI71517.1 hypothetical protein [Naumannella cuiyingiana]